MLLVVGSLLAALTGFAQPLPVELVGNTQTLWYGHSFTKNFDKQPRLGVSHVTSGVLPLAGNQPGEWMSQNYLSWQIRSGIRLNVGSFYASKPGIQPSLGVQFSRFRSDYGVLLTPRVDPNGFQTRELFGLLEIKPRLNVKFRLYSRLQFMFNYTQNVHNRSYQYLRLGLQHMKFDFGLAYQQDVYGPTKLRFGQSGLYLRHSFH